MKYLSILALSLAALTGCTTHLATGQKHKLEDKQLTYEQHIREQRTIEARYSAY